MIVGWDTVHFPPYFNWLEYWKDTLSFSCADML